MKARIVPSLYRIKSNLEKEKELNSEREEKK